MARKNKLISCDFDGTIVRHKFPDIGDPLPHAIDVLKELQEAGHHLILNTCREDSRKRKYLSEAVKFCMDHGITFRSINENHRDDDFRDDGGRKVYADYYIDDRNLGGFPGWLAVKKEILG